MHWSVFGGGTNFRCPDQVMGHGEINNWTGSFDVKAVSFARKTQAMFTVQLAGVKTALGNKDVFNLLQPYSNLPFVVAVNGKDLEP
jgi:rhamnogalacturonan endolyase